jgi:crotonobetainyl-CoA:carnitine CoA-transferase CaiB-like acyl-CoA transferase
MGPLATQLLCDLGADVIHVEPPEGDRMRLGGNSPDPDMGPLFWHLNRGKSSVVADLRTEEGRVTLLGLCADADVFVTNVRPAALARAGFGYDNLHTLNRELIYVSMVGFGQDGPYAPLPAYDDLMQAYCGIVDTLGRTTDGGPHYVPYNLCDRSVGLYAFGCITTALFERSRSGRGQFVEIPMFETMSALVLGEHLNGRSYEPPIGDAGYQRLMDRERKPYRTLDGYVCALVYTPPQWKRFLEAIDAADHPVKGGEQTFLHQQFATRTTAEWITLLQSADVPVAPMNSLDDLIEDPHLKEVGFIVEVDGVRTPRVPSRWSETPPGPARPAPKLDEH